MSDDASNLVKHLSYRVTHIDASLRQALSNATDYEQLLDADHEADGCLAAALFGLDRSLQQLENYMDKMDFLPDAAHPETTADSIDTAGDNSSADFEKALLLQALDSQEARIHQLEEQLRTLQNDDNRVVTPGPASKRREPSRLITNDSLEENPYANRMIIAVQDQGNVKVALTGSITTIGRDADNDIQIRSRFVSRYHARILSDQDGVFIEDLESRNGISVNMQKTARQQLRSGDFIKVGRMQLQYIDIMEDCHASVA